MLASDSEYDFVLCTTAADLLAAYNLRLEVFHKEQKFPEETEVDGNDPVSAHFVVKSKKDAVVVATVRLVPYPESNDRNLNPAPVDKLLPLGGERNEAKIVNEFQMADCIGAKLGRMAVEKSNRGKGIGAMTVREAENWLIRSLVGKKTLTVAISSQMQAKQFYEKMEYLCYGEPYDEEGMDHIMCRKELIAQV